MKTNRNESAVKAAIHAYLDTRTDLYFWRQNNGVATFGDFPVRFAVNGVGDFIGVQACLTALGIEYGRFVAIEAKRERGGKQSEDQVRFQKNVERHGGLYVLAKSVDDVVQALGPVLVHVVKERKARVIPR